MSSVKAVVRTKPNSQGLYPIAIRITRDRKTSFIYIGQYIKKCQWDYTIGQVKKSHPDALNINQLILNRLSKANKKLLSAEVNEEYQSASTIKNKIVFNKTKYDFFMVGKEYLKKIIDRKRFHQYDVEKNRIEVFKTFIKKDILPFNQLKVGLLKKFEMFLIEQKGLAKRTSQNYMITIRTIFNLGIAEFSVKAIQYPFGKGKYQIKFPETQKIGLTREEITSIETLKGLSDAQQYALNVWLLSFYFAGIRIGDVLQLKWIDFRDGRLHYRMGKNSKLVSLKIPKKAKQILRSLNKQKGTTYLFKELEGIDVDDKRLLRTRIKTITRNFNRRLEIVAEKAGIDKKLSMHIARHSFGNISGDKIPIQMLQKLYRHSSVTTTIMYQSNFIQKDTDEALEKVINF